MVSGKITNNEDNTPFGAQTKGSVIGGFSNGLFDTPGSSPIGSTSVTGAFSSPSFGAPSSTSFSGASMFGQKPADSGGFGSTTQLSLSGSLSHESPTLRWFGSPPHEASSKPSVGATSTPEFGPSVNHAFGDSSTPAVGSASSSTCSAFGVSYSPFGSTTPTLEATNTPAFGASSTAALRASSTPVFGSLPTPTFGVSVTVAFGAPPTPVFGPSSVPAFTASSTPVFGSLPTPAFGATSFSFSFSFSPAFGQSAPAFGSSPLGAQSSPFGAHTTAPDFRISGSGQPYQQHVGSILPPYAQTTEAFTSNGTQPAEKPESISANEEKSHEELRWKDYQSGYKGGPTSNLSGSAQSQTPSLFRATFSFRAPTSPFRTPNTSNPGTTMSLFGTTQARGINSVFGNTQLSPLFQSNSPALGLMNSPRGTGPNFGCTVPSLGISTPFGTKNTSSSGTSTITPGFGARTSPSPFDTPKTSTSVSGSTPCFGAITRPSPFGSGFNFGTQSENLFQSISPFGQKSSDLFQSISPFGQTSSPVAQTGLAFEQSTSAFSQSNASEGMFSSIPLISTGSMGFNQTTSSFSPSFQFADQPAQSPVGSHLVETTGGTGSTSNKCEALVSSDLPASMYPQNIQCE